MFAPIRDRFRAGAAIAGADYVAGLRALDGERAAWAAATAGYDAVLMPTTANLPPDVERLLADPALYAAENLLALRNPTLANLLGLCALTLPTGVPVLRPDADGPGRRRRPAAAARPRRRARARLGTQNAGPRRDFDARFRPERGDCRDPGDEAQRCSFPRGSQTCRNTPFRGCGRLLAGTPRGGPELAMTIGEPQAPDAALRRRDHRRPRRASSAATRRTRARPSSAPPSPAGSPAATASTVDPETQLIALNGSREGLFNAALALSPETKRGARPAVLVPNPFYQAYGAGALAAGAELVPVPATAATGFLPDYAALPPRAPRPRDPRLPLLAVEPAGRGRRRRPASRRLLAPRRAPRLPRPRRRVLQRDLPRRAAARRARRRRDRRRRPRAGARLQLALQALERPRPARRLRRRRPARPSPRCAGSAPTAARRCRCRCSARRPRSGRTRPTSRRAARSTAPSSRSPTACSPASPATPPPQGGFFLWLPVGDGEAAALRLWRETGVRVLPGGYLGRATRRRAEPGRRTTSASRSSPTPPRSSAGSRRSATRSRLRSKERV